MVVVLLCPFGMSCVFFFGALFFLEVSGMRFQVEVWDRRS